MTNQLSQLALQVPGFINEHSNSKRRRDSTGPLDLCSQFFDFSAFYGEGEPSNTGTRTRSVASSEPGLTSGPSEEDGARSPSPSDDSFQSKDTIKQVKQHDDRFTVPEREIRPKGGLPYPSNIHLDNVPSPTSSSPTGNNVVILSNPGSPTIFDAAVGDNHPLHRGRRTRPLENPEKVAVMRQLGACYRCRMRKVQCDDKAPCSNCTKDAAKIQYANCDDLAEQMCFRHHPSPIFRGLINAENSPRPNTSTGCTFNVFFQPLTTGSPSLVLNVEQANSPVSHGMGGRHHRYTLCAEQARYIDNNIVDWASKQIEREGNNSLQSALDIMVIYCAENERRELPHSDLLRSVKRLRCLYKAWRQRSFVCQRQPRCELEELPYEIHRSLKAVLARAITDVEKDVLKNLLERKPKSQSDRLPLWVCWMQVILFYRDLASIAGSQEPRLDGDLQRKVEGLMNYAVVMCDLHFSKKKPAATVEDETNSRICLTTWLEKVEFQQSEFFAEIRQSGRKSDNMLKALLANSQKCSTRLRLPAQKRAKRST
ncbi:hypothetical protein HD806DRAFT_529693 [Xylariaceae sp. AK1471]|nr:hypothetical protein HD806DRAFT_529693 [Xylariaceae sp. AK1471]